VRFELLPEFLMVTERVALRRSLRRRMAGARVKTWRA